MSNLYIIDKIAKGGAEKILNQVKSEDSLVSVIIDSGDGSICTGISDNGYFGKALNTICLIYKLFFIVRKKNILRIISFLERSNFVAVLLSMITKREVTISVHNYLSKQYDSKSKLSKFIIKFLIGFLYNKSDNIICVSNGIKEDLVKNFNVNSRKIRVIYNGVDGLMKDTKNKRSFDRTSPFLFVGRITYQKGIDNLVKCYLNYTLNGGKRSLVIIGEEIDDLSNYCEYESITSLNEIDTCNPGIYYLGTTDNVYKFMSVSHALLLTSRWEGFGLVLAESMMCGTPVVTFNTPSGPSEILDVELESTSSSIGKGGILVEQENISEFSKAMLNLEDANLWLILSETATNRALLFDKNKMINEWDNVIEGAL